MPLALTDLLAGRGIAGAPPLEPSAILPCAVVTMELQRGVMGDLASFPELAAACDDVHLVGHAARLIARARKAHVPIVHCLAEFTADRTGTVINTPLHAAVLRRPEHLLAGTPATDIVPGLGAHSSDPRSIRRHGVAPFVGTDLDATLRDLGVRALIVVGVSINLGILGLCIEAVDLGYQVVVATDAVAGVPSDYAATVLATSVSLVASLATVDQLITALGDETSRRAVPNSER
jgi:nicotinamidase-related amidase